jgi:CDP-L-myo-inositol myo-inositolphosphotransferase
MSRSGSAASLVKPIDGIVSRTLNRRVSTRISMRLARLKHPPSPDLVSVISAAVVGLGGLGFAAGYPWLGGILAQLGSILDGVDGEIARLTGRQSKAGALLDTVLDRLADIVLLVGVAFAALQVLNPTSALLLSLLAVTGDLLVTYLHAYGEKVAGVHPVLVGRIPGIASRDVRLFTVFILGLVGRPDWALAAVAALGYAYTLAKTGELVRYLEHSGSRG